VVFDATNAGKVGTVSVAAGASLYLWCSGAALGRPTGMAGGVEQLHANNETVLGAKDRGNGVPDRGQRWFPGQSAVFAEDPGFQRCLNGRHHVGACRTRIQIDVLAEASLR